MVKLTAVPGFLGAPSDWAFLTEAFDVEVVRADSIPTEGDILLGYSMGGRLALRALLAGARYRRAVIVSAGLGIEGEEVRAERRKADELWAQRFESEPWPSLIEEWNAQPVFVGSNILPRQESDYDRPELARQLREWSPAALEPMAPRLAAITRPVLWIAGERDQKYVEEAKRAVTLLPDAELWICPGAGHRVPWDQPELFVARLQAL
jgi:2-succinyl-6-hydroxy-2,4-cyclohexadiene-1-carboxylate synthase